MAWVEVTKVEDVPAGKGTVVSVNRQEFALFHVGDEFFCTDNACPHRDGPLGMGELTGEVVMCPWHAWEFNVRTGEAQYAGCDLQTFPCKVEDGAVWVDVNLG
jgi:nitrite reductase (NADH) small subunit